MQICSWMGKKNFKQIYQDAARNLGERPTIKLSSFCDVYSPYSKYAGMIVYHTYGRHRWKQWPGHGIAAGHRGRSFYAIIICTDNWPQDARRAAGQGQVHDYLYRQYFDMKTSRRKTCCGGFAVLHGTIAHSSVYVNDQSGSVRGLRWQSDGSKYLSQLEQTLVHLVIAEWRHTAAGPGTVVEIPDILHARLMSSSIPQPSFARKFDNFNPRADAKDHAPTESFLTLAVAALMAFICRLFRF